MSTVLALTAGALAGALVAVLVASGRHRQRLDAAELAHARAHGELEARLAASEASLRSETALLEAFEGLSHRALDSSAHRLLDLANERFGRLEQSAQHQGELRHRAVESLVEPVRSHLDQLREVIATVERQRQRDQGTLRQAVEQLRTTTTGLQSETRTLATAMRDVRSRGAWGELQLRRVVELAGMVEHCDFVAQPSMRTPDGHVRPDLVAWLPRGRAVVVDAKVPLDAFLDACDDHDPAAAARRLGDHAAAVFGHARALARRDYTTAVEGAVDVVVMFVPGEGFLAAACEADPGLIERCLSEGVVLATPTTLVALLKAVSLGWREERLADHAREIAVLGGELHDRLATMGEHLDKLGRSLETSMRRFNAAAGSFDQRLVPSARRIAEHGADVKKVLPVVGAVETPPRSLGLTADGAPTPHPGEVEPTRLAS